ncbi:MULTISPECIES: Sua5/YciO/YrdC/YwlC family protein [unclassified Methylocaldum]|jgi:L-threonylcarbamoyladenylate synthase|uniref:L-threonylcarbamoyladenylate synthase n=1 Tax=unclassified Methylocaldum TaxID=2622260 RepID=UPI000A3277F1|nr:Sua5/YciO/YrdC/YwlC family protein [Methylocaldum sp. RMAD-M]MBP1150139.1 L-threonylcarbamoyladenylate synthase [Methylocaldum sp. RMAD-M]
MLSPFRLRLAASHLRRGGIIAYPTEGVYGLGCDPLDQDAVRRLLALKERPSAKGLILIAAEFDQIEPYLDIPTEFMRSRLLATWPGPVTWIVPAASWVPAWLRGEHATLAVRVTAHPDAAALCRAFGGPIISTSANKSGRPPARTPISARKHFSTGRVLIFPGRLGGLRGPTAIYDASTGVRLR